MADPLDALRLPDEPVRPDPTFAARLRERVARALLAPGPVSPSEPRPSPTQEQQMTSNTLSRSEFRNGVKHGDVSYVTLVVPDVARAREFYNAVLGWTYSPGSDPVFGAQVDEIAPMTGLWAGPQPVGPQTYGAVLGFRVEDIRAAVAAVRGAGGSVSEPHEEPYGIAAEGLDNQGIPFYLHEAPSMTGVSTPTNGTVEGDMSYITMVVPDVEKARDFYAAVLGWTFNSGPGGMQVNDTVPQIGIGPVSKEMFETPRAVLCYRVDDIAAAIERVRAAGGTASAAAQRPYGLESLAADDQGTPLFLHQLG